VTITRIKRGVDARAYPDLEYAVARLESHPFERHEPPRMQRRTKCQVIDFGQLLVDGFNEVILDGRHRQRTGGSIRAEIIVSFEQGHSRLLTCGPVLPGIDPDSTRATAVSTVARNLFDWLNFRQLHATGHARTADRHYTGPFRSRQALFT